MIEEFVFNRRDFLLTAFHSATAHTLDMLPPSMKDAKNFLGNNTIDTTGFSKIRHVVAGDLRIGYVDVGPPQGSV